ncbi:MAG: ABC transporter substrate-binding protein [Oscillospiraceae bacterium]
MKRRIIAAVLTISMMLGMVGCSSKNAPTDKSTDNSSTVDTSTSKDVPETNVVRWNFGTSGNVLVTIAQEKGYFKEYGIDLEIINATANADAMSLLSTNQVDIVSNSGTSNPLQLLASGVDITVFGGHMVTGCMPVIAKKGTKWNGTKDLIGKKFACNPSYFAFTGAVMDLGYEKPLEAVEWVTYSNYSDAMAAVIKGEVDYALQGTGQNFAVNENPDVEIMCYQSDVMPNYSCCRLVCPTEFVNKNPITVKLIMKALLRAQCYFETNKEEAIAMQAKKIDVSEEYVKAYMLNDHYLVHADPIKNSVVRAWNVLDATGFLSENAKNTKIEDHVNTEIYEAAMNEVITEYGNENPEFYNSLRTFFEENNR